MPLGGRGTSSRRCECCGCGCSCDFGFAPWGVVWAVCVCVCDWVDLPLLCEAAGFCSGVDSIRNGSGGTEARAPLDGAAAAGGTGSSLLR